MNRIHRLLRLITLLQSGRAKTSRELMRELEISRRTLFRDLKMLEMAGIPYYHEPQRGYRIKQSFFLAPVSLSIPETLALMVLAKRTEADPEHPLTQAALSAINKLTATVAEPIREACEDLTASVSVNSGSRPIRDSPDDTYITLQRCIDEGRVCRMTYQSLFEGQTLECELHPYALHFATRAWYVLGRTDLHDEVRVFKLARIQRLETTERLFVKPRRSRGGRGFRGFRVTDKLGNAWRLIPEGREYDIELAFSPKVAVNVSEIRWHRTQQHQMHADGSCTMTFRVDGLREIAWWLCGYAGEVRVRKPAELRQLLREMHLRAAERNSDEET